MHNANFECGRVKVEVPLEDEEEIKKLNLPSFGNYYEWHGKISCTNNNLLNKELPRLKGVHLSRNSLKNEPNNRFLTVRSTGSKKSYKKEVEELKMSIDKWVKSGEINILKEEYEYCVSDSRWGVDYGWLEPFQEGEEHFGEELYSPEFLKIKDKPYNMLEMVFDSFVKRMDYVNKPLLNNYSQFVIKGSLLTRQYIKDRTKRRVADLDILYVGPEKDPETVNVLFTHWLKSVVSVDLKDDIKIQLDQYHYWQRIDYAMDDDFPTTSSSLKANWHHHYISFDIDISWNLPSNFNMVPMDYITENDEVIELKESIPIPVQIAWKLHQTVIRPRMKDVYDIILLLENNTLSKQDLYLLYNVYKDECDHGAVNETDILVFADDKIFRMNDESTAKDFETRVKENEVINKFGFDCDFKSLIKHSSIPLPYKNEKEILSEFSRLLRDSGFVDILKLDVLGPTKSD